MYRDIIIKENSRFFEDCPVPLVADDVGAYRICMKLVKYADARCIKVTAMRSDGVTITDSAAIAGDTAYYIIARNMYAAEGKLNLRISLLDTNNNALTTKIMTFDVLGMWEEGLSGENNYPIVYEALAAAQKAAQTAKDNTQKIEDMSSRLENAENDLRDEISARANTDEKIYSEMGRVVINTNTSIIKLSEFSSIGAYLFDEGDIFTAENDLGESVDTLMYSGDASWVFSKTLAAGMCYALKIESKPVGGADWSNGEISVLAEAIYDETLGWQVNDLAQRVADLESGGIEGGTTSVSTVKQWIKNNYLPLSGGEMDNGAEIMTTNANNRKAVLTGNGLKLIPNTTLVGAYAYGVNYRNPSNTENIGGFGMYGYDDNVNYYYVGKDYADPLAKITPTGNITAKNNIYRPQYSFLLKYYQNSDEPKQVVAAKLGSFACFDTKATIDIVGRNTFNVKQAGQKYTLTLAFNSLQYGTFPLGGMLYYYGDFNGLTGDIDTTANRISIQLVQSKEDSTWCDVYLLLNQPAAYSIFKIDVSCLSDTTWKKDVQWITDTADIPEVNGTTSYVVATKNVAFEDSTVDKAISDKNGNDITETYAKINDAQTTPYDTGRVWFNGEAIMRQDYCIVVKKDSTAWNDGAIYYADCINGNVSTIDGILEWSAFGNYTDVPTSTDGTYDINPIDWVKLDIDADGRNIILNPASNAPYDCIVIAGHIEYVQNGGGIPQSSITKIFE